MDVIRPNGLLGTGPVRMDGLSKVTGRATFGADHSVPSAAHAALCLSPIARGTLQSIDCTAALAMHGVLAIFTHENTAQDLKPGKSMMEGGHLAQNGRPLEKKIRFAGQIVAMVVADTFETAQAAAHAIQCTFMPARSVSASFDSPGAKTVKAESLGESALHAGNIDHGLRDAAAIVDAWYDTPTQHHNPMELFQTTCAWSDDSQQLTVWESTQNVRGYQYGLAEVLRLKPSQVRILSPFIGGAFGSRGELSHQTALVALAARRLGRPVKLVASRRQGFTLRTMRAETRHHLKLAAAANGALTALDHESWEVCGREDHFAVAGSDSTARLYACPNVRAVVHNVETDRQAPGFMRAPPETPYLFPLECAMDELAYALHMDPLDLRRRNDTLVETVTNLPYTSRGLLRCINHGAELFGWAARNHTPRSLATPHELIGWGFASAMYPTQVGPAECRLTLGTRPTGELFASVEVGAHEIGTGIRTVIAMTAADLLGLALEDVDVAIGDSDLPAAPLAAGSNSTASVCSVVARACETLRGRIARAAVRDKKSPLFNADPDHIRLLEGHASSRPPEVHTEALQRAVLRVSRGRPLVVRASNTPHGAPPVIGQAMIRRGKPVTLGGSRLKDRMQFAFGAQFVEVRIDRATGMISVPRMVGVFAAGRIMNERTARAQLQGGQIWGISSALHESTELHEPLARYANQDLAEYHVPVAADIGNITTVMLDETDTQVNPLGIKGVGELGVTGVNAAISNAIFHATGTRLRRLPIRPGDLNL